MRDVQPKAAPALAVTRGIEEPVDDRRKGVGRGVGEKIIHLLGGRWQTRQVERGPAQQGHFVRGSRGSQALPQKFGKDKTVHRCLHPMPTILHRRDRRLRHPLIGPMLPGFFLVEDVMRRLLRSSHARIGRTHLDPSFQIGDLIVRELPVIGRHLEIFVLIADRLEEEAFPGVSGNDGRTGVPAFQHSFLGIEEQAALHFLAGFAVTLVTVLGEERADLAFEKLGLLGRELRLSARSDKRNHRKGQGRQAEQTSQRAPAMPEV